MAGDQSEPVMASGRASKPRERMRIVVINPHSNVAVTRDIDAALDGLRLPGGPIIDCVTLDEGPCGIEAQRDVGVALPDYTAGTVYLGEQAVSEGYDRTRITAHELGHILGLPDNYNGDCSILMSGHSAGTSCTNAKPGASEAAQVDQIFAGNAAIVRTRTVTVGVF